MASRWLRWPRRPSDEAQGDAALTHLTSVFLDIDKRQSIAQTAVNAAVALTSQKHLAGEWLVVQNACYEASAVYLDIVGRTAGRDSSFGSKPATEAEVAHASGLLESARSGIDTFYDRHRSVLDSAANASSALTSEADASLRAALDVRRRLAAADPRHVAYPSVRAAAEQLDAATTRLQAGRDSGDLAATRAAVEQVQHSVATASDVLDAAPQREEQARRTLASVRTRTDAVRTRAAGVPALVSALLREFNAKSTADLVDNEKVSRVHMDRAEALYAKAAAARDANQPEAAMEYANQARSELADAERHVDDVSDRLTLLREIRSEPERRAQDVRFRLRDAQRLAVDRGVVSEWGSVLDAQSERIDRIIEGIGGAHPDYWAYHRSLGEVSDFITNVISRIRQGAVR